MTTEAIEIDDATRRGHLKFKRSREFMYTCGDGKTRTLDQWLIWMRTWDPLTEEKPPAKKPAKKKSTRPPRTTD